MNYRLAWFSGLIISLLLLSSFYSSGNPGSFLPLVGFRINEGNRYTNQAKITVEIKSLKLIDSLVADMKVGLDPELTDVPWVKYTTDSRTLILADGDGEKYVYARLRDIAGNVSPVESSRIFLDTHPPQNITITINEEEMYTSDDKRRVLISIKSDDDDLEEMIFSNKKDFSEARWENMSGSKRWILDGTGGDGKKIVYAKFKDRAGNISQVFEEDIILDTSPPENGSITINNDEKITQKTEIVLRIRANDAQSVRIVSPGKSEVLEFNPDEDNNYMEVNWELDSSEGTKVVRVYFMDAAKNRTTTVIQDEIILDRTGPRSPHITINGNKKYTNHKEGRVTLRLTTRVNPDQIKMMVSNYLDFNDAKAISFRPEITNWQLLAEEDGMKSVYAKYIDEAGNHSEVSMAKIILDRMAPVINSMMVNDGGGWSTSIKATINLDVTDASHMQINNTSAIKNQLIWETYLPQKVDWGLIPGDGPKIVYLRFKDAAENMTEIVTTNVTLDTKPPTGELVIDEGNRYSNNPDGNVNLRITSLDAKGMQLINKPDFTDIKLTPFNPQIEKWVFEGEDGMKTVFLRLRDEAGNFSNVITASIILDRQAPEQLHLTINEGQEWVRNPARRASVQMEAKGATHYRIGEIREFTEEQWEPFKNVVLWVFSEEEGKKELFAQFKDLAGNLSEIITASITLDYTPPVCEKFEIDGGADFTNDTQTKVTLTIISPDAVKMALSNSPISDPADPSLLWEDYAESKEWVLEGEDGIKTVFLVLVDAAGNYSGRYNDKIILDRIGPSNVVVKLNMGDKYVPAGGRKIGLEMEAEGADKVFITEDPNFENGRWEMFVPRKVYEVSESDGEKTIYIKFRDKALNESETISGTVILDTTPPEAISVELNNGKKFTNNQGKSIPLTIEVTGAVEMRISQKGHAPGPWIPYKSELNYIILGGDGEKEIGVFLRDEAGNISKPIVYTIILDRTPPKPVSLIIDNNEGWTNNTDKKVTLNIVATEAHEMIISTQPSFSGADWQIYNQKVTDFILPGEDGEKIIFVRFRDETGNESQVISAKVNLKRSF